MTFANVLERLSCLLLKHAVGLQHIFNDTHRGIAETEVSPCVLLLDTASCLQLLRHLCVCVTYIQSLAC